jgi:hypothetical protein
MTHPLTAENHARLKGKLVVASVSGGKDSAALSLWLTEHGIEHRRVFADTGWEHQDTYTYLRGPLTAVLGPIEEVRGPETFEELVSRKGMFPSRLIRFCTVELKVRPLFAYMNALAEGGGGRDVVNAIGIRAAESRARADLTEWDASDGLDAEVWRPLIARPTPDPPGPAQVKRVRPESVAPVEGDHVVLGPCIHASKGELRVIADTDPTRIDRVRDLEARVGAACTARAESNGVPVDPKRLPTFFQAFVADEDGQRLRIPIDRAVAWSRTTRGGKQIALFNEGAHDGCARWGMCESTSGDA